MCLSVAGEYAIIRVRSEDVFIVCLFLCRCNVADLKKILLIEKDCYHFFAYFL